MRQLFVDGAWVDALDGRTFETFDPATGAVLDTVAAASDVQEVADLANDTEYGLAAATWTRDIGRELGPYALAAYLETKQIYVNLA